MAKIYLDPGHGGSDSGATYKGRREADDVLKMSLAVGKKLEDAGVEVKYSRTTDKDKLLNDRTKESNNWGADYYLSIHRNSFDGNATGDEIWVISSATDNTKAKAQKILSRLCSADMLANRGVKNGAPSYSDFAVNKYTNCASALLEMGFITSEKDNEALDSYFNEISTAIAKSLCEIVGVTYNTVPVKGDTDGDGKVTSEDARKTLRASLKLEKLDKEAEKRSDINDDGKITTKDAREVLRKSLNLE